MEAPFAVLIAGFLDVARGRQDIPET
jgi:hypothetical protein